MCSSREQAREAGSAATEATPQTSSGDGTGVPNAWSLLAEARLATIRANISTSSNTEDSKVALQKVNEELAALDNVVASMRIRQNALSPVMILPPETLSRIFMWVARSERPSTAIDWGSNRNRDSQTSAKLGWIKVTHVCHAWRDTALNDASLWTTLSFGCAPLTHIMLKRSRDQGLIICEGQDNRSIPKTDIKESGLYEHASRIRVLDLGTNSKLKKGILAALSEPAPLLESVRVVGRYAQPSTGKDYVDEKHIPLLGSHTFGGQTPRLRRLVLDHARISWDSPILLSGLTHLEVRLPANCMVKTHERSMISMSGPPPKRWLPTHVQLMSVLNASPALATLILERSVPEDDPELKVWIQRSSNAQAAPAPPPLALHHLRMVELDGSFNACAHLLSCLIIPPDASLLVTAEAGTISGIERIDKDVLAKEMFAASDRSLRRMSSLRVKQMRESECVAIEGWPAPLGLPVYPSIYHTSKPPQPTVKLHLNMRDGGYLTLWNKQDIASAVLSTFEPSSVEEIEVITDDRYLPVSTWWTYFAEMRNVRIVQASDECAKGLTSALTLIPQKPGPTGTSPTPARPEPEMVTVPDGTAPETPLFPALKELAFSNVDFQKGISISVKNTAFYDHFLKSLLLRKTWKIPLNKLHLRDCTIHEKWVNELKKAVPEVVWDGIELRWEDDPEKSEDEDEYDDEDSYGYYGYGSP
ncbi:hypothetical protein DENSPDRAFT_927352 [Dentipellis sp. KUC8613]|nr:hypothetical protein DENSPDRAFT_927352 [Dentipellis sp. KUC8613]